LGCETTAPCDTSFKARCIEIIEIFLLTYLLTYLEQTLIDDAVDQRRTRLRAVIVPVADILNILCDYQFVFFVLDELYVSQQA